jgi:hypothetical protein
MLRGSVALFPALGFAVLVYAVVLWRLDIPDPVATHFDLVGSPDDTLPRDIFLGLLLAVAAGSALIGGTASLLVSARVRLSGFAAATTFASWLVAGIGLWTLLSQQGLNSWTQSRGPSVGVLFAMVVIPAAAAAAASALALQLPIPPLTWASAPLLEAAEVDDVSWSQRVVAPWMVLPVMFGLGLAVMGRFSGFGLLIWIGLLVAFVGVQMRSLKVTADRKGLLLSWGPLGLPRQRLPLEHITQASAIDVRPRDWGGWGYRGNLRGFGAAGAILRAGPGLRLDLEEGHVFVVTVDDPEIGSGVLNKFIRRTRDGSS